MKSTHLVAARIRQIFSRDEARTQDPKNHDPNIFDSCAFEPYRVKLVGDEGRL
jgi:hypothetical protein